MFSSYRLVRVLRTSSSEVYLIWDGENRIGQADIHYPGQYREAIIHATLIIEALLSEDEEAALVAQIDEDLVAAYLPHFDRQDFLVTVYRGRETNQYNDSRMPGETV